MHIMCIEPFGLSSPGDDMPDVPDGVAAELIRAGKAVKVEPDAAEPDESSEASAVKPLNKNVKPSKVSRK